MGQQLKYVHRITDTGSTDVATSVLNSSQSSSTVRHPLDQSKQTGKKKFSTLPPNVRRISGYREEFNPSVIMPRRRHFQVLYWLKLKLFSLFKAHAIMND
jgi:hypothetical protein